MITIRRLKPGEGELYKEVRLTALQEAPYAFSTTYESAITRNIHSWNEQADASALGPDRATFIACSDGSPVGMTSLYRKPDEEDSGELLQVWVAPAHRGTGVATKLFKTTLLWAAGNGYRKIYATTKKDNSRALRFYQKQGFKSVGDDSSNKCVLMRLVE